MIRTVLQNIINRFQSYIYFRRKKIFGFIFQLLSNEQTRSNLIYFLSKKIIGQLEHSLIFKDISFGPHLIVSAGLSRYVNIESNLDQVNLFLNLENISGHPSVLLMPGHKERVLFVTAMFPSTKHAGGLRIFDMIRKLSKKYKVSLYSVYTQDDEGSFNTLKDNLEYVRLIAGSSFSNKDLMDWLKDKNEHFLFAYHVWPDSSKLLVTTKNIAKMTLFEHSEVVTRSYFLDLKNIDSDSRAPLFNQFTRLFVHSYIAEYIACTLADISITLTDADEKFLKEAFNKKQTYIMPTGVSDFAVLDKIKNEPSSLKNSTPSAAFLGYYNHTPNLLAVEWFLANALDKIVAKIPDFKICIIGKGNLEPLKSIFTSSAIEWIGEVEDFVPYIKNSTICVAPLVSGAGFRGKINQYSACQKATVSTTIGVSGLSYTHQRDILIADQASDFVTQVIRLLLDTELRKTIEKNAFDLVTSHYSWDSTLSSFERYLANYENNMDTSSTIH